MSNLAAARYCKVCYLLDNKGCIRFLQVYTKPNPPNIVANKVDSQYGELPLEEMNGNSKNDATGSGYPHLTRIYGHSTNTIQ